jgi:hypothetical protein
MRRHGPINGRQGFLIIVDLAITAYGPVQRNESCSDHLRRNLNFTSGAASRGAGCGGVNVPALMAVCQVYNPPNFLLVYGAHNGCTTPGVYRPQDS